MRMKLTASEMEREQLEEERGKLEATVQKVRWISSHFLPPFHLLSSAFLYGLRCFVVFHSQRGPIKPMCCVQRIETRFCSLLRTCIHRQTARQ